MSRLMTLTDLLTLQHKPRSLTLLNDEALLLQRHHSLVFGLRSLLGNHSRYTTYVHHEGSISGVLHARSRESRPEQQLVAL
ncbi:MAG: hypothetical protein EBS29_01720, partial [Chloroflexia bacterium]|nr:hypothetical protein [Chloroflexia bacterium]